MNFSNPPSPWNNLYETFKTFATRWKPKLYTKGQFDQQPTSSRLSAPLKTFTTPRSTNLALVLVSLVILMLGFSYAAVPFYQIFCQTTGFGGTIQRTQELSLQNLKPLDQAGPETTLFSNRTTSQFETNKETNSQMSFGQQNAAQLLTVHFNADTSPNLPWSFKQSQNKIQVFPGDTALTFYLAENQSDRNITGISTYHVSPPQMGIYFNKIQCFCFEEQLLKSHEKIEMPVLFYIDKEFLNDPQMKDIKTLSLSYTFFQAPNSTTSGF